MTNPMSWRSGLAGMCLLMAAASVPVVLAAETKVDAAASVAADAPAAVAAYPLDTCVVSGDKLEAGEMGPPINYVYKQEGQPDRLVRFCCKHCIKKFNKNPAKYLKLIDDAAAKAEKTEKPGAAPAAGHD